MFELDIEDTILYGDMLKEECIQQAPGYFAQASRAEDGVQAQEAAIWSEARSMHIFIKQWF